MASERGGAASIHLDALRGLAALAVFVGHWRSLLFVDYYTDSLVRGPVIQAVYLLTSLGHQAVMVFFVLSGYLISGSILGALQRGRWSWSSYLISRLSRLLIVLVPGVILTAVWDRLGMGLYGSARVYGGSPACGHIIDFVVRERAGVWTALGNLFFLQTIVTPTFGSNSPLWSLANEFWYYIAFPLLAVPFARRGSWLLTVLSVAGALAVLAFCGSSIAHYFIVWLLGVLVRLLPTTPKFRPGYARALAVLVLCGSLLQQALRVPMGQFQVDLIVGLACAFLLYCNASAGGETVPALYGRLAKFMSKVSYSLYVYHLPLLVLLSACLLRDGHRWQPDATHVAYALGVAGIALACVVGLWAITEAHTDRLRQFLTRAIKKPQAAAN